MTNDCHQRCRRQWFLSVPMMNHHRQGSLPSLMVERCCIRGNQTHSEPHTQAVSRGRPHCYRRQWFLSVLMMNHHRQGSLPSLMVERRCIRGNQTHSEPHTQAVSRGRPHCYHQSLFSLRYGASQQVDTRLMNKMNPPPSPDRRGLQLAK
jgi:hypothetical protein